MWCSAAHAAHRAAGLQPHRHRPGGGGEHVADLPPFVPGRASWATSTSAACPASAPRARRTCALLQNVYAAEYSLVHSRGPAPPEGGRCWPSTTGRTCTTRRSAWASTPSPNLETFLRNTPLRFIGLTPDADARPPLALQPVRRLPAGRRAPRPAASPSTPACATNHRPCPRTRRAATSTLLTLSDPEPTHGPALGEPDLDNLSPRLGFAWDVVGDGRTALRGGYGLYFNTNNHQNHIVTVTNPPFTPRIVIANPTFPVPAFSRAGGQLDPARAVGPRGAARARVERQRAARAVAARDPDRRLRGVARPEPAAQRRREHAAAPAARGRHARSTRRARRGPNTAFSAIEQKTSDGDSWYNALDRRAARAAPRAASASSPPTRSRGTSTPPRPRRSSRTPPTAPTSAFPEYGLDYNKGLADYHAKHNWVFNVTWDLPIARDDEGAPMRSSADWQLAAIGQIPQRHRRSPRSCRPTARARSGRPRIGPGMGFDRPSLAPGRTPEDAVLGRPRPVVRPDGLRAAARRPARQPGPRRADRPGPARGGPGAGEAHPVHQAGRRGRGSSCASRPSTSSTG